jgi:iron(III) transport system substrate-binding protein
VDEVDEVDRVDAVDIVNFLRSLKRAPIIFRIPSVPSVLSVLCVLSVACGGGSSAPEGESRAAPAGARTRQVVVFSPHGQEILDAFEAAFEAAHPDIDVVTRDMGTGDIFTQLRIDKAAPRVDVWWGGTTAFFNQAKTEGLLQPYRPTWAEAVAPAHRDPDDLWFAQFEHVAAVTFNRDIMTPDDAPATWDALLDERWRNRIVIREPMQSGTMKTIFAAQIWRLGGEARDPAPGYEYLKQLDSRTRAYLPNPTALFDRIAQSAAGYISLWNLTDIIFQAERNQYPFGYRIPEGPTPTWLDPIGIVAGAPHLEEAKLFYEFVTSKESGLRMARENFRILTRTDIADEEKPDWQRAIRFTPMEIDVDAFDRLQVEWMEHWRREIRDPDK